MALAANALTTLAELKSELGISGAEFDTALERVINAVSDAVASYLGRPIHFEENIVEKVSGYDSVFLSVERTPVVVIDNIKYNDTDIESTEYEVVKPNTGHIFRNSGWIWTAGHQSNITRDPIPGSEDPLYTVTYDGGWVTPQQVLDNPTWTRTLPYDLEDAVLKAAASRWAKRGKDTTIASEKLMSYSVAYGKTSSSGFSAEVESTLNSYRSVSVG